MARISKKSALAQRPAAALRTPSKTRDRIVQCAIALFNRYGIQNVAIDHIASDLKISPGNLTYHFRRKDDLIHATLDVLKDRLRVALERPVAVNSAQDGAEYLIRVFRTLWELRFFFNSLTFLLTDNQQLRKEYAQFRGWVIDTIEADIGYMVERGLFHPAVAPNTFRLLAENLWGHFLNWLRLQQIESPSAATPSNQAIYDGALHLWSICQLWLNPSFADELLRVFQTLLLPAQTIAAKRPVARKRKTTT